MVAKPRPTKNSNKSRLAQRKKLPVHLCDKVPVRNSLHEWSKLIKEYKDKMAPRTPVSSLMFLEVSKIGNVEGNTFGLAASSTPMKEKLQLEDHTFTKRVFSLSQTVIYDLGMRHEEHVASVYLVNGGREVVALTSKALWFVSACKVLALDDWNGGSEMACHQVHDTLLALTCADGKIRILTSDFGDVHLVSVIPKYKSVPKTVQFLHDSDHLLVGYENGTHVL